MTGGLMQLVATGAQDVYLTGNPMITYFKIVYRRHTNFAMESICQTFDTEVDFGTTVTSLISRNGDLISSIYFQVTLPDLPADADNYHYAVWTDNVGHHLIKQVDFIVGGQLIDRQYGDWFEIWSQLTVPAGKMLGYREMIGQDPPGALGLNSGLQRDRTTVLPGRTIYIPLQFWFCRNVGLALPLISLQYHEVKIQMVLRQASELISCFDTQQDGDTLPTNIGEILKLSSAALWVDYIYLDVEERRRFAQVTHEYLIEQLQLNTMTVNGSSTLQEVTMDLHLNHTVKELIWVVQYDAGVTNGHVQWSNYTDRSSINFPTSGNGVLNLVNLGTIMYDVVTSLKGSSTNFRAATNPSHVRPPDSLNPVESARLLLNGNERFDKQTGEFFNLVQPFNYHTNVPESPGINVYSFSLNPELHQPSGTCNFSRIDKPQLVLNIKPGFNHSTLPSDDSVCSQFVQSHLTIRVYAVNYNIFRIMSGMGAVAYTL
jgi:hypothetical protein